MAGLEDILIRIRGQDQTGSAFGSIESKASHMGSAVTSAIGMLGGMIGYDIVNGLVEAGRGAVNASGQLDYFAGRLGMTEEQSANFRKQLDGMQKDFRKVNMTAVGATAEDLAARYQLPIDKLSGLTKMTAVMSSEFIRNGRSQEDAVLAVADAMDGQFKRLQEIGITQDTLKNNGWNGNLEDQASLIDALNKTMENMGYDKIAADITNLDDAWQALTVAGGNLIASVLVPMTPILLGVAEALINAMDFLKDNPFAMAAVGIGALAAGFLYLAGTAAAAGTSMMSIVVASLPGFISNIATAVGGLISLATAQSAVTAEEVMAAAAHASNGVAVSAEGLAALEASGGFWEMAAAELAALWPVLLIIAAVAAFIIAVEQIGEALGWWTDFGTMIDAIRAGVMRLWEAFINSPQIQGVLQGIQGAFEALWGVVGPIFEWLGAAWNNLFKSDGPGSGGPDVVGMIINAFAQLGNVASQVFTTLQNGWNALVNFIRPVTDALQGVFYLFQLLSQGQITFSQALSYMGNILGTMVSGMAANFGNLASQIIPMLTNALVQIPGIIGGALSQIPGIIGGALSQIPGIIGGALSQLPGIVGNIISTIGSLALSGALGLGPQLIAFVIGLVAEMGGSILSSIDGIINDISNGIMESFSGIGEFIGTSIINAIIAPFAGITSILSSILGPLGQNIGSDIQSSVTSALSGVLGPVENIGTGIYDVMEASLEAVSDLFIESWTAISSTVTGVIGPMVDAFSTLSTIFSDLMSGQLNLGDAISLAWNVIGSTILEQIFNVDESLSSFALALVDIAFSVASSFVQAFLPQFAEVPLMVRNYLRNGIIGINDALLDWVSAAGESAMLFVDNMIDGISQLPGMILGYIMQIPGVMSFVSNAASTLASAGSAIISRARSIGTGIYNGIINGIRGIGSGVSGALSGIGGRVSALGTSIVARARSTGVGMANAIANGIRNTPARVGQILRGIVIRIAGLRGAIVARARSIATGIRTGILNRISSIPGRIGGIIGRIPGLIAGAAGAVAGAAAGLASQAVNAVISGFSGLAGKVYQEFVNIGNKIRESVSSAVSAATAFGNDIKAAVLGALGIASPGIIQKKIAIEFADIPGRIKESITAVSRSAREYANGILDGFGNPSVTGNLNLNPNVTGSIPQPFSMGGLINPLLNNFLSGSLNVNSLSGLNSSSTYTPMANRGGNVTIIVSEGAVQLDARNLTTAESKQVMINALEGMDMIRGDYGY